MRQWEYLEVWVNYARCDWYDSSGRQGDLISNEADGSYDLATPLLNELGHQGWELTGVGSYADPDRAHLIFKRAGGIN